VELLDRLAILPARQVQRLPCVLFRFFSFARTWPISNGCRKAEVPAIRRLYGVLLMLLKKAPAAGCHLRGTPAGETSNEAISGLKQP